ncbi:MULTISPECIES: AAA-like domain-containing protein [unclassified Microcoleus]|uniref:AAA-like domain-containing protein n=1 Tax=unclassified Microcoleus TaxID=2642155 RepID=UPI002FD77599
MAGLQKLPNLIQTVADLEFPGGPIPLDSRFYIDRSGAEALACAEISKPGGLVRIKAPKKMGKSSLMLRIVHATVDRAVVTISWGIASVVPGPENDAATLVLAADEALYDSKRHGRDRLTMSTLLNFRFAAVN